MAVIPGSVADARAALDAGDAEQALRLARTALEQGEDPEALTVAVEAAVETAADDAVDLARRLVATAPDDAAAHRLLGDVLLTEGDLEGAAAALRTAVRLDPADTGAVVALGHLTRRQGRESDAADLLEQAAAAQPDDVGLLRNLVDVHRLAGRTRKALEWAERLVTHTPQDPLALLDLAELHLAVGEHDAAREAFTRLRDVEAEPGRAVLAWHGMVEAELRAERLRAALDLAVAATAVDRNQTTSDLLAHVVARVFGEGDRPAPGTDEIYAALAGERREHRRVLEEEVAA